MKLQAYSILLSVEQINLINQAVQELPLRVAYPLLQDIGRQIKEADEAQGPGDSESEPSALSPTRIAGG